MLGTRTKHVFAYGRRGHRVVTVSDDIEGRRARDAAPVDVRRENAIPAPAKAAEDSPVSLKTSIVTRKAGQRAKKNKTSPKVLKVNAPKSPKSKRLPLGSIMPNAPGSPAVPPQLKAKRRQTVVRPSPLVPSSPIVDVDILVLDAEGRRVSQERRISRSNVPANVLAVPSPLQTKPTTRGKAVARRDLIVLSSDSEEDLPLTRRKPRTRGRMANPTIISDDESSQSDYEPSPKDSSSNDASFDGTPLPRVKRGHQRARPKVVLSPSPSPTPSLSPGSSPPNTPPRPPAKSTRLVPVVEIPIVRSHTLPSQPSRPPPLAPFSSTPQVGEAGPSRSKPRRLTPIRARQGRTIFPAPPSPPSPTTPTDLDLTFDFAQLALSPNALAEVQQLEEAIPPPPAYVRPLLEECSQTNPHEFSAFIDMFPFDPIVRETSHETGATTGAGPPRFLKIGEASFSEVFGIGGVVLKIVPLRDEERAAEADYSEVEGPAPSDAKDVLKEIIVTRAMGATCPGFVELLRTYIVRGKYPSLLLDLWDEYDERKGSEGIRPDTFSVSQLYAIIVLPNGGPDLEAYTFSTPTKTGWRQACSVFWQVARTLAEAEELVSFEHRDLHWGQILVKNVPAKSSGRRRTRVSMDDADHGVLVTIIDLGLARMDAHDGDGHHIHWTPFDEETFEGEGDYQFDIYRMMRTHNGDSWEDFKPLTNVMWLHYLALKLLNAKRLRAPAASRKSSAPASSAGFTERDCYDCLKEVEALLGQCLAGVKAPPAVRKGRRKTQAPSKATKMEVQGPKSASELVEMAIGRGWVLA
ncbi:hypothetical protein FKP32DRAFT_1587628 [Trametes sanguinea]|nr:hypothetical protein FKP32DRAFT_1587628 [Trametes sanguinea]